MSTEDQSITQAPARAHHTAPPTAPKLVYCPYGVFDNREARDSFYDVRDALFAARKQQRAAPGAQVKVTDTRTGRLMIEVGD